MTCTTSAKKSQSRWRGSSADRWQTPRRQIDRRPAIARDIDLGAAFAAICKSVDRAGIELLEVMLADPRRESCRLGVSYVISAGITEDTFFSEDQRIIFRAATITRPEHRLDHVLLLARRWLRAANCWDDTDPRHFARGPRWSDISLEALVDQWPGPSYTRVYAPRLLNLSERRQKAIEHFDYLKTLIGEAA